MHKRLRIVIVGPGRAGTAVGLAARRAGHDIVGVLGRSNPVPRAALLAAPVLDWGSPLPVCELVVVAVRDDAIRSVAGRLAPMAGGAAAAVHLSGLTAVEALAALGEAGMEIGGFHPLQTMPTPEAGAAALSGAAVGITAEPPLEGTLEDLAVSLGSRPFRLEDGKRPVYHAAAACAANYVLTALGLAQGLFEAAGVPFESARPLVTEIVANAFDLGPRAALTGPIARGDLGTVSAQLAAVAAADPDLVEDFKAFGRATARLAGAADSMLELLR